MTDLSPNGLHLADVSIALNGHTLLHVDHVVAPGEVFTIMGPSGSGKSSLLAFIAGFLDPAFTATGRIICGGEDITDLPPQQRHGGLLFQDPLLFPHMSVAGNLVFAIPAEVHGAGERRSRARQALVEIDMEGFAGADPDTLSGGQKARVALARVLLAQPRFLLLDEPFSKLDMELRQQMRELVFGRAKAAKLPVVLVTHDKADADAAAGPVIDLGAGLRN